jgi:hypothetical protein
MRTIPKAIRILLLVGLALSLSGCEQPQVYGSIGYSSYGGYRGGLSGGITIGGRLF